MNTVLCIYHKNCADGFAGATVLNRALRSSCHIDFYAGVHGGEKPEIKKGQYSTIYFVDFSYDPETILEYSQLAENVVILDHHESAMKSMSDVDLPINVHTHFDMDKSGAVITFEYFYIDVLVPLFLEYIQDHDLWKHQLSNSKEVSAGIYSLDFNFDEWESMIFSYDEEQVIENLRKRGEIILSYRQDEIDNMIEKGKYRCMFDGFDVPCINVPHSFASDVGSILSKNEHFAVCWERQSNGYKISLRSQTGYGMNVADIAKKFGGGGHPNAAGIYLSFMDFVRYEMNDMFNISG